MARDRCAGCSEMIRNWEGYHSSKERRILCDRCYDIEDHASQPEQNGFVKRA